MSKLLLYPTLNGDLLKKIKFNGDEKLQFYFTDKEKQVDLSIGVDYVNNSTVLMNDSNNRWFVEHNNLIIKRKLEFYTSGLFGRSGIAPKNSTIGIAIKYGSSSSAYRVTKNISSFDSLTEKVEIDGKFQFEKNTIRDEVKFSYILYLKDIPDIIEYEEKHLNTTVGTILGTLLEVDLIFSGNKSSFNTVLVDDKSLPLWYLRMDFDPTNLVRDSVELVINKSHRDYGLFDYNDKIYDRFFLEEVKISIVTQIIVRSLDFKSEIDELEFEVGTLGHLVKYYYQIFNLDTDRMEDVYKAVSGGIR